MANLVPVLSWRFYKFTPYQRRTNTTLASTGHTCKYQSARRIFNENEQQDHSNQCSLDGTGQHTTYRTGRYHGGPVTQDEIEVVLAHELGHHVHHDIWKLIISQAVLMLVGLYIASIVLHWAIDTQHYYLTLTDAATLPFFFLLVGIFSLIIMPISNGYSRAIEYQADEYALSSTKKIAAFKSAMTHLANQNLSDVEPAAMIEFFFHSHPSINKRLKHADELPRGKFIKRVHLSVPIIEHLQHQPTR